MGPPKTWKTGAVVGTYPKPMLYLGFDRGGLDVIPSRAEPLPPDRIKIDTFREDIEFVTPQELPAVQKRQEQPRVTACLFVDRAIQPLTLQLQPAPERNAFEQFVNAYNALLSGPFPWKTVVLDSLTGLEDAILSWIAATQPALFKDPRQWAGATGGKVRSIVLSLTSWPCHVVCVLHTILEKHELTETLVEMPSLFSSGLRNDFSGLFSQVFYATKRNGVPVVWTTDIQWVRGVGPRWPINLKSEVCPPTFENLYPCLCQPTGENTSNA